MTTSMLQARYGINPRLNPFICADQLSEPRQTGPRLNTISSERRDCHWLEKRPGSELHQSGGSLHHQEGEEDPGNH